MKRILRISGLVILFCLAIYIYWFYFNVYSEGERKGVLVKVTKKGNLFKTNEGEMWLSCRQMVNIEKFYFSMSDQKLADTLANLQDQCIQVAYHQYRKTLAWRGETEYVVTGFKRATN
jgi:hypothetical protein